MIKQVRRIALIILCLSVPSAMCVSPARVPADEPHWTLFVMRPDGSDARMLVQTPDHTRHSFPRWSRDGSRVAFSAFGGTRSGRHLYVVHADGSGLVEIGTDGLPDWSPDDKQLVYSEHAKGGQSYVQNLDGGGRTQIAAGICPRWSPDGSLIAVTNHKTIHVVDLLTSEVRDLFEEPFERVFEGYNWSPDGKWLAVSTKTSPTSSSKLLLVSSQGEKHGLKHLRTGSQGGSASFSPDGKQLVFAEGWKIRIFNVDGGRPHLVPGQSGRNKDPHWSPDGQWIVFASDRD